MISALSSENTSSSSSTGPRCPGTGGRTAHSALAPQVSSRPVPADQQVPRGPENSPLSLTTFSPLSLGDSHPRAFRVGFGYFPSKRLQFRVCLPRAGSHVLRNTGPAEPPSSPSGLVPPQHPRVSGALLCPSPRCPRGVLLLDTESPGSRAGPRLSHQAVSVSVACD